MNESILNKLLVREKLPLVINGLTKFAFTNKGQKNVENLLVGEAYTLIRRHIPHLVETVISLSKCNIERVYVCHTTGKILYFNFIKNYGGCIHENIIDSLNEILNNFDPKYESYAFGFQLNAITKKIEEYNIK